MTMTEERRGDWHGSPSDADALIALHYLNRALSTLPRAALARHGATRPVAVFDCAGAGDGARHAGAALVRVGVSVI
jgi:hypothetical protein